MGCCESCLNPEPKYDDPDAARPTDPLINPVNGQAPPSSMGDTHIQSQVSVTQPKGDEQSALSRILNKNASNVIDVAAVDRGIEQHDFHDKARQYSNRVNMVLSSSGRSRQYKQSQLPVGVSVPFQVLSTQPISTGDIELITVCAVKANQAVKEVKVEHKEDLVVPFGVP